MDETQQFTWSDRVKALTKVKLVDGNVDVLPPHVRRRVVALVDPVHILVADIDVAELPTGPRRVSGTAAFFTDKLAIIVSLDGVTWAGTGDEDKPPAVQLRRLRDVSSVSAEGDSVGWAPNEWGDDPRGHYRLTFNDGMSMLFPARPRMHTPEMHHLIAQLTAETS